MAWNIAPRAPSVRSPAAVAARSARRTVEACVAERVLVLMGACQGRDAGDYDTAVEAVIADPCEREGLSADALAAVSYIEGIADAWDCTALELLDALSISVNSHTA